MAGILADCAVMRRGTVLYNTLIHKYECFGVILVLKFLLTSPETDQTRSASPTSCLSAPTFCKSTGCCYV